MNRENRKFLKDKNIRHTGKPLGRKPKEDLNRYQKEKLKKERDLRNHIEGKFGQGKSKYGLNNIKARLADTSKFWIAAIMFVINILKLAKDYSFDLFYHLFLMLCFLKTNKNPTQKMILIEL